MYVYYNKPYVNINMLCYNKRLYAYAIYILISIWGKNLPKRKISELKEILLFLLNKYLR